MKNKKLLLILSLAVLTIFALAGCGSQATQKNATTEKKTEPVKSILEQVQNTGHAKFFADWVSKGPEGAAAGHYGDNCIGCHSAVKMIDDKNAVLKDFYPGGKYDGKTEGVSCRVCHKFEGKEMVQLKTPGWDACASCHTGGKIVLGKEVHHPQGEMIKGVAVGELQAKPSFKYNKFPDGKDFSCYTCHVTNGTKHDFLLPGETITHNGITRTGTKMDWNKFKEIFKNDQCSGCHNNPDDVVNSLKSHQAEIGKQLEQLKPTYDKWSKDILAQKVDVNDPKVKAFQEGATYYTFVEADSSKGAHNYDYAKELLNKAAEKWKGL